MSHVADKKFEHKKSLGQHFLNSDVVPKWLCDAADIQAGEMVLEIGPGTGALTKELLKRGARVVALEADLRAIALLQETFEREVASGHLALHHTDARTLDLATYPELADHTFKVVANIPYYLSGHLFRSLLESPLQPTTLVYLVQKEVASRIARTQKESLLSLSIKAYGTPTYVRTVSRGHFTPPPKVDSAIIAVRNITRDNFTTIPEADFFAFLHQAFGQKRKQLQGTLGVIYGRDRVSHALKTFGYPATARAEVVSPNHWFSLFTMLHTPTTSSSQ